MHSEKDFVFIQWVYGILFVLNSSLQITPAKDGKPVMIELIDAKTKEPKDTLEVEKCCPAV